MPSRHATLGPSASARWLTCTASVAMEELAPPRPEANFAQEGTLAHELAELTASRELGLVPARDLEPRFVAWEKEAREFFGDSADQELDAMHDFVGWYVDFLEEARGLDGVVFLEQRLPAGVEGCWGTSDAVVVTPDTVHIVDFKYGKGVEVSPVENPQLMLYALGALDKYRDLLDTTTKVKMSIHQPRINNVGSWEVTPDYLTTWREEVARPAAARALSKDEGEFHPSEKACRFCPAAGICKARAESIIQDAFSEEDPRVISLEDRAKYLKRVGEFKSWLKALEESSLDMAYSQGVKIPDWKVVRSGSRRVIQDEADAFKRLEEAGYEPDQFSKRKILGVTELDRLVGKANFWDVLGDSAATRPGRPSLVPESDRRKAITKKSDSKALFDD